MKIFIFSVKFIPVTAKACLSHKPAHTCYVSVFLNIFLFHIAKRGERSYNNFDDSKLENCENFLLPNLYERKESCK